MKAFILLLILAVASASQYYSGTLCSIQYVNGAYSLQTCYDLNSWGCVTGGQFNNADVCLVPYGNYGMDYPAIHYVPGSSQYAQITALFNKVNATYWHVATGTYFSCGANTGTNIDFGFFYKGLH